MISREELKDKILLLASRFFSLEELKCWNDIVKDLEVLSVLKKHFKVEFDDKTENGLDDVQFNGLDLDDIWASGCYDDDFKLIKEWLEEDV